MSSPRARTAKQAVQGDTAPISLHLVDSGKLKTSNSQIAPLKKRNNESGDEASLHNMLQVAPSPQHASG